MVGLATTLFIGLVVLGQDFLGWSSGSNEKVQLGLFLAFVLGILCGYKSRG